MPKVIDVAARIQRWHWGRIALLWAWGSIAVALLLTDFLSQPIQPGPSSITFVGALSILVGLSVLTWVWLGSHTSSAP
jgi:hypothetical protein